VENGKITRKVIVPLLIQRAISITVTRFETTQRFLRDHATCDEGGVTIAVGENGAAWG